MKSLKVNTDMNVIREFVKYDDDNQYATQLQLKFKKKFYVVVLKNHGIVAYFQKRSNAEGYLNEILNGLDTYALYNGIHYNIIELSFND